MRRTMTIAALICLVPWDAYADGRINFRIDLNATNVVSAYNQVGLDWQGAEFEVEKEFTKSKVLLSGFSLGVRRELFYAFTGFGGTKDVHRWDEGTYLSLRIYRSFGKRSWSIGPSFAILYGIPGTTLDRTVDHRDRGGNGYTHVFPKETPMFRSCSRRRRSSLRIQRCSIRKHLSPSERDSPRGSSISTGLAGSGSSDLGSWIQILKETYSLKSRS